MTMDATALAQFVPVKEATGRRLVNILRELIRRWQVRHDLAKLSDGELRDIGIIRANIPAVAEFIAGGGSWSRLGHLGIGGSAQRAYGGVNS